MKYRFSLVNCSAMLLTLISLSCTPSQEVSEIESLESPNIIFILADDLGYGDLGSYSQEVIQTPNIDRMAKEGMRFTQHYAGSTVCAPSRSVLMTGLHTGHTPIRGNFEIQPMGQMPLPANSQTVAEYLQEQDYATGLIGKWGLGGPDSSGEPNRQGFDYFYGYLGQRHAHNYFPEFLFRNTTRVILEGNEVAERRPDGAGQAIQRAQYTPDLFLDQALAFLDRNQERSFFLYFAATLPHANNEAGEEGMEIPDYGNYADEDWPEPQKAHAAMISHLDRDVGLMLRKLNALGLDQNTLVLFASDNGPHREGGADPDFFNSNGPLRGIKRDLYEGGIRVPLIARWPGQIESGSTSDHISAFWDLLPTFLEVVGIEVPDGIDGISFLPELRGEDQRGHEYLYWEFKSSQAVRMGEWKGVRQNPADPLELYNLETDLSETNDISEAQPEIVSQIERIMEDAHRPSERFPLTQ